MADTNTKLIRILQILGFFFLFAAAYIPVADLALDLDWNQVSAIFFLAYLLLCGVCFGMAGLISENPEGTRKFFFEWLVVVTLVIVWVIWVYALL